MNEDGRSPSFEVPIFMELFNEEQLVPLHEKTSKMPEIPSKMLLVWLFVISNLLQYY